MTLTVEEVKKIAKLSRIRLSDDEIKRYQDELNQIFKWVEQLREVDTNDVPPMAGVGDYTLRQREDMVQDGNIQQDVLANAPNASYGCFVVPKVVE